MLNFQKHAWPSISGYVASTLQVNFNHNKYKKDPVFKSKSTLTNSVLNLSWRTASVTTSTEKKTKMTVILRCRSSATHKCTRIKASYGLQMYVQNSFHTTL